MREGIQDVTRMTKRYNTVYEDFLRRHQEKITQKNRTFYTSWLIRLPVAAVPQPVSGKRQVHPTDNEASKMQLPCMLQVFLVFQ